MRTLAFLAVPLIVAAVVGFTVVVPALESINALTVALTAGR